MLAKPPEKITLKELIETLEGAIALNLCLVRKEECDRSDSCPVYPIWCEAQDRMVEVLERTTVAELVGRLEPAEARRPPR